MQLFRNETNEWIHVTVNNEEIVCTPNHPFYSPIKGWTNACDLRAGDILVTVNGEYVVVEKIQHELLENPEITYNFEVEGFHTYYVGDTEVLVHNKCQFGNTKYHSEHESRNAAFRSAKRDAGIPMSEQPVNISQSVDRAGRAIPGNTYTFRNGVQIMEHSIGHPEYGIGPHFNVSDSKWHYLYP